MFSGGDDDAQASQDSTVTDPVTAADDATDVTDTSAPQLGGIQMPDLTQADQSEAAELPAIVPPTTAPASPSVITDTSTPSATVSVAADDLLDIKQQALQQLTPLLGHLDQSPEERFRTTMMLIQASDNSALLKSAYDAAQQIGDEKVRAQALLDVVNEINYFTQHDGGPGPAPEV